MKKIVTFVARWAFLLNNVVSWILTLLFGKLARISKEREDAVDCAK